jgi:hypothetical protein
MISNHLYKYDAINFSFILQNGWLLLLILCKYIIVYTSNHTNDHNIAICMMCTPKGMGYEGVKNKKNSCIKVFFVVYMLEYFYLENEIQKWNLKLKFPWIVFN